MIKLLDILRENKILVPRRSPEERQKNYQIILQKKIQQYIKDGGKGDLDLSSTPLQSLPDNLEVGGSLYLYSTSIQSLPPGLKVGGNLSLRDTPLQSLPNGLKVEGYLDLENCKNLKSLPNGLEVKRFLDLTNTPIQSLPDGLKVGEYLNLKNTPISKKYISEKYTEDEIRKMIPGVKSQIFL